MRYTEGPFPLDFIAREASGSRSRDAITVEGDELLPPGTLLSGAIGGAFRQATSAGECTAILLYWADPREGPVAVSALTRDAEINDAYLVYRDMQPNAVAFALREQGIILRMGVLVNPATPFATSRVPWPAETVGTPAMADHDPSVQVGEPVGNALVHGLTADEPEHGTDSPETAS